jgi:hypothetical protein
MSKIFLCYRRDDSEWPAQWIYNDLVKHFGSESVVWDIDTIPYGVDFREYLNKEVSKCDILLAVIGDKWLEILKQRSDQPNDFVRVEIQAALERGIPVVPILVGEKPVPNEEDLPPELANLSYTQAAKVRAGADLNTHLKRLVEGLDRRLSDLEAEEELKQKEIDNDVMSNLRWFVRFAELGGEMAEFDMTAAAAMKNETLEKFWGETGHGRTSYDWFLQAITRGRSVARLGPNEFDGLGSGILIDGSWIDDSWDGRNLLLTNAHVCTNDPAAKAQYPYPPGPEEITATFLGSEGKPIQINVETILWTSSTSEFDASLLEISNIPAGTAEKAPIAAKIPTFADWPEKRLYLLGHPQHLDLRLLLQGNNLVTVSERYFHYMKSNNFLFSGSPIFNYNWELVGIHSSASRDKSVNEGIRIDQVLKEIRRGLYR